MATKTLKFYGQGYGTVPCTVVATMNGTTVYSGAVPTVEPQYVDRDPAAQVELFSTTIDSATVGLLPMTIQVTAGDGVYSAQTLCNYTKILNPAYTAEQRAVIVDPSSTDAQKTAIYEVVANPPLSPADITILQSSAYEDGPAKLAIIESHNLEVMINGGENDYGSTSPGADERENVTLDGEAVEMPTRPPYGTYGWFVHNGSTLAFDLVIS